MQLLQRIAPVRALTVYDLVTKLMVRLQGTLDKDVVRSCQLTLGFCVVARMSSDLECNVLIE